MALISLLVPVFNAEPHLGAALTAMLAQAGEDVEVVALDDGSLDGSRATLNAFARRAPGTLRIVEHGQRQGVGAARNRLLAQSRGEFVWFVDADDELQPGAVVALRRVIARDRPDLVLCDFRVLREHGRLRHRLRGEAHRRTFGGPSGTVLTDPSSVLAGLFERGEFHVWSKIVRRAAWPTDLQFPTGRYFEDLALVPALVAACPRAIHVAEPWIGYRSHPASALGSIDAGKLDDWWVALRSMALSVGAQGALDAHCRGAMAGFIANSIVRMCRVARGLGLGPDWDRDRLRELRTEGWMPPGLLLGHYLRSGRLWRWFPARALGLR